MTMGLQHPAPAGSASLYTQETPRRVALVSGSYLRDDYVEGALGQAQAPALHRLTVLVVDDEPAITALLSELLEIAGFDALTATNGRTALAIARREHPALVITDRLMPELDGIEFVRRLRASPVTNDIPVVLMSSTRPTHEQIGDIPFLPKPFDLDEVLAVISQYAAHEPNAQAAR